jgi:hypothetical protein
MVLPSGHNDNATCQLRADIVEKVLCGTDANFLKIAYAFDAV